MPNQCDYENFFLNVRLEEKTRSHIFGKTRGRICDQILGELQIRDLGKGWEICVRKSRGDVFRCSL